jgi:phosphotransferase system HPr (HPr) family protein
MATASRETTIVNKLGLHARPAMQFVDVANQFSSKVMVYKGGEEPAEADGKSIMNMLTLAALEGAPLRIVAEGEDAEQAVRKLVELVENKFGED